MSRFFQLFLSVAVIFVAASCSNRARPGKECTAENHCRLKNDVAACERGYVWEDPDDQDNNACVEPPCECDTDASCNTACVCDSNCGVCDQENDQQFCSRHTAECGVVNELDLCNNLRAISCGSCTNQESCFAKSCECVPETASQLCLAVGKDCGELTARDRCGFQTTVNCGGCGIGEQCGGTTGPANVCNCLGETDAELCSAYSVSCGDATIVDGCGTTRTITCPDTCVGPETCGGSFGSNTCGQIICTTDDWCRGSSPLASGADYVYPGAIWASASDDIWMVGSYASIFHFDGAAWEQWGQLEAGADFEAVWGASAASPWLAGQNGLGYAFNASSWEAITGLSQMDVYGIWGVDANDVWAVGSSKFGSQGYVSHYDGIGWEDSYLSSLDTFYAIWGAAWNDIWAVGAYGYIYHYDGTDWTMHTKPTTNSLYGIWGLGADNVWAVGAAGTIAHWDGNTWTAEQVGTSALRGIMGSSASNIWAVGDGGTILNYAGSGWVAQNSGTSRDFGAIWVFSDGKAWVGAEGAVILSHSP